MGGKFFLLFCAMMVVTFVGPTALQKGDIVTGWVFGLQTGM